MKKILFVCLLALAGCSKPSPVITVSHDDAHGVTCWITSTEAISCLPNTVVLDCQGDHQSGKTATSVSRNEERVWP